MCGNYGYRESDLSDKASAFEPLDPMLKYIDGLRYCRKEAEGLLTLESGKLVSSKAMWWYQHKLDYSFARPKYVPDWNLTTFNARELDRPFWRDALTCRRALVLATRVGESEGKAKYLLKSTEPIFMGALYKDWINPNGDKQRSFAVITRPPHPRFSKYHSKSIPFFLPAENSTLLDWLDPTKTPSKEIRELLSHPQIFNDFEVTPVKSYKHAEPMGPTELLQADIKRS